VVADLRADPYLPYVLVLAALLAGFWFWHRLPNFATRDEQARIFDPLVALGTYLADPSVESFREGVAWGRVPFGATFYLNAVALVPVVLAAVVLGQLDAFLAFDTPPRHLGYFYIWQETPAWMWTVSLSIVRLVNVAFAVGCVYLTYRLGVQLRDRATGRLAALLLTFTFGFLTVAHEGGEDVPALFFTLLSLALLVSYVRTGEAAPFLLASAFGGVAIAFKLTAAPIVAVVAAAYLLRVHRAGPEWRSALVRPWLIVGGAVAGLAAIVLGFPTLLVGEADVVLHRIAGGSASRTEWSTGPDAPVWWWFLRQYLNAFGLPLFVGAVGGVVATLARLDDRGRDLHATTLLLVALAANVLLYVPWHDFRVHHLLPTFPLLVLLLATALVDLRGRSPGAARVLLAILLLSGGAYATAGVLSYADSPRDDAVAWFEAHADRDDTVEVYRVHVQDTAVPHWMDVNAAHLAAAGREDPCPEYVMLGYRDLMYLVEGSYYRNGEAQAAYVRALLEGEYPYEVVAEFGPRPPNYVPQRPTPGSLVDLVRVGIVPWTDQYADEQELRENQYTVILERTGECDGPRTVPDRWL